MNNKVDKLFKDKLETHTLQPSARAWEKVESHLSKKNKMVVWLRVAAAIALLGIVAFVVVDFKKPETQIVKEEIKPTIAPEKKIEEPRQVVEVPKKKKSQPKKLVAPIVPQVQQEQQEQVALVVEEPAPVVVEEAPKKEKSITLVYSLPTIKKEEPAAAVATVEEPKKTGFERVLEIAKEVKNADNPLGQLREAKDDIFAFEFKNKDKNKKQN